MLGLILVVGAFLIFQQLGWLPKLLFALAAGFIAVRLATMSKTKAAVMAIATAIAAIAGAITAKRSPPLYLLLPIVAAGLWLFGKAAMSAAPGIAYLGVSLVSLGIGLSTMAAAAFIVLAGVSLLIAAAALLAAAFSLLMDSVAGVVGQLAGLFEVFILINPLKLFALAAGLVVLGAAILLVSATVGGMGGFMLRGFKRVIRVIAQVARALNIFSTDKLNAFVAFIEKLKDLKEMGDVALTLSMIGAGIGRIAVDLLFLPVAKSIAFTNMMDGVSKVATKVTPEAVEATSQMVEKVKEVAAIDVSLTNVLLLNAIGNLISVLNDAGRRADAEAGGAAGAGETTVVLEVDGRQLGRTVVELINGRYNMRLAS